MKKALLSILFIILFLNLSFAEESEKKINIAVTEFEARNVSSMDAATISDFVRTELVKSRLFKVLDRNNMAMILEEQEFQLSGCTTQECAVQMGKLLNVSNVVIGNLTKLAEIYYITASVIDIETGEIAYSERIEAASARDILKASEELGRVLASLISGKEVRTVPSPTVSGKPDRIIITKINKEKNAVTVNRGILNKVLKRNIYNVYDDTEVIAKLIISKAGPEEAVGVLKYQKAEVLPRMPALYKARKKIGTVGFMIGPAVGDSLQGFGGSFYYDYIAISDWGLQLNAGLWIGTIEKDLNIGTGFVAVDSSSEEKYSVTVSYIIPVILKKYFNAISSVSPYIGIGICPVEHKYEEYTKNWLDTKVVSHEESEVGMGFVLNGGVNLFNFSKLQITLDLKILMSDEYRGYETHLTAFSTCVSIGW